MAERIVIVGGGAGGLELATRLGRRLRGRAEITLVDRETAHVWKPRLHEVAVGLIDPADDAVGYLTHSRRSHYRFALGSLKSIDATHRSVMLGEVKSRATGHVLLAERELPYDRLILAIGSRVNDFNVPGVREHCLMLDTAAQATAVRTRLLEAAIQSRDGAGPFRVGIVGAGATGVELAAELNHAAISANRQGGLGNPEKLEIVLVDQSQRVLAPADPRTSAALARELSDLDVSLLLGQGVAKVTADALHLADGREIACDLMIWASGVIGHDCVSEFRDLRIGRGRRIEVDEQLACVGVTGVYAIGDCAVAPAHDGVVPPTTAQVAHQQAAYLANALEHSMEGRKVKPFAYRPQGILVSLGAATAVAELPFWRKRPFSAQGLMPKLLYVSLFHAHRATLHGWPRAAARFLADRLRGATSPLIKLH